MTPERLAEITHDCDLGVEQEAQIDELIRAARESIKLRELLQEVMNEGVEHDAKKYALVQMSHPLREAIRAALEEPK